ncbi:MAG: hypothetical protein OHK0032_14910 [Thermodesulfovibrionales bacterium]
MFQWLTNRLPMGRLAVVPFTGAVFSRTVEPYLRLLRAIEYSRYIRGVLFQIESPGGSASSSEMLYHSLKSLNSKKPVYCYALMAASGGFMAACGARRISAPSTALMGSIGVLSVKPVLRDFMDRFGIRLEVMKKGINKDMTLFHRESTEEEKKKMDALHEDIYQRFIEIVAEGRRLSRERVSEIATGELFTAKRSLELGLIDEISDYESFLDKLAAEAGVKKERAILLRPRRPFLYRIMGESASTAIEEFYSLLISESIRGM